MFSERVTRRLDNIAILPETRTALTAMVSQDWAAADVEQHRPLAAIIRLYELLGGTGDGIRTFGAAWTTLRAALARLDHLQDNDPEDHVIPTIAHTGAQYNVVFAYYMLADALLDDLDEISLHHSRLLQLRRLWAECLLRAASGQQHDLSTVGLEQDCDLNPLDHVQQVAQAKSGAIFELAFGGAAILATDDRAYIDVCRAFGELYGTLIQFRDDLADAEHQTAPALTLPQMYSAALAIHDSVVPPHTLHPYWQYIYNAYHEQAREMLMSLPSEIKAGALELLSEAFE